MFLAFLKILFTILIVVDPIGLVPVFLSLSSDLSEAKRKRVIWTAVGVAASVLFLFILAGAPLLAFLGISTGAFYVSGGILLLLFSIDMLYGRARRSQTSGEKSGEEDESINVAIFPLAIPMLSGPGSITTIMLFMSSGESTLTTGAMLILSVLITMGAAALAMLGSKLIMRLIGKLGVVVLERIMGLLLAGLAVQFIYRGLSLLGVVKA